jgi:hypothetical protein
MESPYSPAPPDPLAPGDPLGMPIAPPIIGPASLDPLHPMLDALENAIAPPITGANIFADPLGRQLDRLEASIERPLSHPTNKGYLDALEAAIEQRPPDPGHLAGSQGLMDKMGHKPDQPLRAAAQKDAWSSKEETIPPPKDVLSGTQRPALHTPLSPRAEGRPPKEPFLRQNPEPTYRFTGHSTGVRNTDPPKDWYCYLHQEWVARDRCESCPDFEKAEESAETAEEGRCQHTFFSLTEEDGEEV